ncbi:MAG: HEAT repeat domain-containing protein [Phycisphaerales bacterium]
MNTAHVAARRIAALGAGAALMLTSASCGPARSAAGATDAARPAGQPDDTDGSTQAASIEHSQVRERALMLLANATASPDAEERYNAIEALIPVPSRLEPAVRRGLIDPDDRVRIVSAMAVGKAQLKTVAPFVRPLLTDKSEMVQASAVYALTRCGEQVSPQPLGSLLDHPRPLMRAHAAWILGELGDESALPMVREAARAPMGRADPAQTRIYRLQLCEAMIKLGDHRALDEVRAALFPSRPEELEATALAVQIIGLVKDRPSQGQLVLLIDRVDSQTGRMPPEVRLAAAAALARMGQRQGGYVAQEHRSSPVGPIRAQSALLYGEIGSRSNLPVLNEMMGDSDPLVRVAAAAAVLKIMDPAR